MFPYLYVMLYGTVGHVLVQHLLLHQHHPLLLLTQVGCLSRDWPLGLSWSQTLAATSTTTHIRRHHGVLYLVVSTHGWSHPLAYVISPTGAEVAQRFGVVVRQHGRCLLLLLGQGILVDIVWLLLAHHAHVVVREVVVHWGFGPIVGGHQRALWCVKGLRWVHHGAVRLVLVKGTRVIGTGWSACRGPVSCLLLLLLLLQQFCTLLSHCF